MVTFVFLFWLFFYLLSESFDLLLYAFVVAVVYLILIYMTMMRYYIVILMIISHNDFVFDALCRYLFLLNAVFFLTNGNPFSKSNKQFIDNIFWTHLWHGNIDCIWLSLLFAEQKQVKLPSVLDTWPKPNIYSDIHHRIAIINVYTIK